jgi:hypothetical protein
MSMRPRPGEARIDFLGAGFALSEPRFVLAPPGTAATYDLPSPVYLRVIEFAEDAFEKLARDPATSDGCTHALGATSCRSSWLTAFGR